MVRAMLAEQGEERRSLEAVSRKRQEMLVVRVLLQGAEAERQRRSYLEQTMYSVLMTEL